MDRKHYAPFYPCLVEKNKLVDQYPHNLHHHYNPQTELWKDLRQPGYDNFGNIQFSRQLEDWPQRPATMHYSPDLHKSMVANQGWFNAY